MANGGWYGTPEEWQRLEAPLLTIDPVLEQFARTHGITLTKNAKDSPERSIRWGDNPNFLIQVYLESEAGPSWNLWLCCSEDRGDSRYWRKDFAVRGARIESFQERLLTLLEESFNRVQQWGADPDQLEFATKLAPMPRL
ncbi:MAG TPA: hypothetical protein VM265_10700 [Sphingomicrobium sp.]|nr:hypothetical protein [Sphingomicrobium sp.]